MRSSAIACARALGRRGRGGPGGRVPRLAGRVDTDKNTIAVTGVTIQADGYPIANLDPTQNYVVSWEQQGGQNVLPNIRPDESGGSRTR